MITFNNLDVSFKIVQKQRYRYWIKELLKSHDRFSCMINIILCSDSYILNLNRQYLRHDYCTDVITFDYSYLFSGNKVAGDIYISIDSVKYNAVRYGALSFEEELLRVIAHGILHIIGFNDVTKDDKNLMRKYEDEAIRLF